MKRLRVVDFGTEVQGVELRGDPKSLPEPESVRITFPGGEVDVTRTTDGEYWVHVRVHDSEDVKASDGEKREGALKDARLDIRGKHTSECNAGDFANPGLYHLAVRVGVRK